MLDRIPSRSAAARPLSPAARSRSASRAVDASIAPGPQPPERLPKVCLALPPQTVYRSLHRRTVHTKGRLQMRATHTVLGKTRNPQQQSATVRNRVRIEGLQIAEIHPTAVQHRHRKARAANLIRFRRQQGKRVQANLRSWNMVLISLANSRRPVYSQCLLSDLRHRKNDTNQGSLYTSRSGTLMLPASGRFQVGTNIMHELSRTQNTRWTQLPCHPPVPQTGHDQDRRARPVRQACRS